MKECAGGGDWTRGRLHAKRTRFRSSYRALSFTQEAIYHVRTEMRQSFGSLPVLSAHSFATNWQLPFLNQWKGENGHRNYFMTKLTKVAGPEDRTCNRPHTRQTCIRSSNRARLSLSCMIMLGLAWLKSDYKSDLLLTALLGQLFYTRKLKMRLTTAIWRDATTSDNH